MAAERKIFPHFESKPQPSITHAGYQPIFANQARESKSYWKLVSYRHHRIANFKLLSLRIVRNFLMYLEPQSDTVKVRVIRFLLSTWVFSNNDQFKKAQVESNCFSPLRVYQTLQQILELNSETKSLSGFVLSYERVKKLFLQLQKIRNIWNQEIKHERLTQGFIDEPMNNEDRVIADKIRFGNWKAIDFLHDDFLKNNLKAFRKKLITKNEFMTAQLLQSAVVRFEQPLNQHVYEAKSIFQIQDYYTFATAEMLEKFYHKIRELPLSEQGFFSIDMPHKHLLYYFMHTITNVALALMPQYLRIFLSAFKEYLTRIAQSATDEAYTKLITTAFSTLERIHTAQDLEKHAEILIHIIKVFDNENIVDADNPIYHTTLPLLVSIPVNFPGIFLSVNSNDLTRPILSQIIPSISSYVLLNKIFYAKNAVKPFPILGQITTRKMAEISKRGSYRGVTMFHPQIAHSKIAHGIQCDAYGFYSHDIIFHTMRESSNPYKKFSEYLRDLVIKTKQTDMDKFIWETIDRDHSTFDLSVARFKGSAEAYSIEKMNLIKQIIFLDLVQNFMANDLTLIFILDLFANEKKWDKLLRDKICQKSAFELLKDCIPEEVSRLRKFNNYLADFSTTFKIICFQICKHTRIDFLASPERQLAFVVNRIDFFKFLDSMDLMKDLFAWKKDAHIYVKLKSFSQAISLIEFVSRESFFEELVADIMIVFSKKLLSDDATNIANTQRIFKSFAFCLNYLNAENLSLTKNFFEPALAKFSTLLETFQKEISETSSQQGYCLTLLTSAQYARELIESSKVRENALERKESAPIITSVPKLSL